MLASTHDNIIASLPPIQALSQMCSSDMHVLLEFVVPNGPTARRYCPYVIAEV